MAVQNRTTLKTYFETGDKPTEAQFIDLIDSLLSRGDDISTVTKLLSAGSETLIDSTEFSPTLNAEPITIMIFNNSTGEVLTGSLALRIVDDGGGGFDLGVYSSDAITVKIKIIK
jgi:hypothetical protein